ncbi:hypothetical protein TVAG_387660 [Trichomonas vaginalis G3]|uniref:NEDD8-activating enzyme E1 catalytic subunit n=1 Tax=Trichomonas vaginalis (strain ATCC PRA-98 / G3) TaxID=412133 RepID=A2E0Z3_TRIV3|nr:NEDD8 activating enzyme protein [Trichomonas vaginalis G3]EAY13625.1 hypothetical protein TVAG_387660 [Trichomonas vaginalis G3]KAI5529892.1 NEDD8 activating enzyme protein [Trichomonas vaginalis G3]|eukprot:XP_001325848.1 hypothetical protein [Trichomonas vaginalis G3]
MLVHIAKSFGKIIPYFDGGSERWMGHIKVIIPTVTACLSCHPEFFVELSEFQLCTTANNPRQPEHCIAYVKEKLWPESFPNLKFNPDDEENIKWIYEKSQEMAQKNNIAGVTYKLVKGVVKNIVPAIASTQAFVASLCVTEVLKYLTGNGYNLRNILISGEEGIYGEDLEYAKMPECHACGSIVIDIHLNDNETVSEFIQRLEKEYNLKNARLVINTDNDRIIPIYSPKIYKESQGNLSKPMKNFVESGSEIIGITPDNLDSTYIIRII